MNGNATGGAADLRAQLAAVRQRWFRAVALRSVGRAGVAGSAAALSGVVADRLFHPVGTPLIVLAALTALLALASVLAVLRRMQRRPDDRHVARFIEERASLDGAGMDDALVSAVAVVETPAADSGFSALILAEALRRLRAVSPDQVIAASVLRRSALEAAAGAVLVLVAVIAAAPSISRTIEATRLHVFPASIRIDVLPGDVRVASGTALRIRASIHDSRGTVSRATALLTVTAEGGIRTVEMAPTADGFAFEFESVDRSFAYTVAAGAARSASYAVTALVPPRVRRIDLEYTYPAFTGLKPRTEEDGGDIYAPAGTRVRLRIHTDKPVARGQLATSGGAVALQQAGDGITEAALVLVKDDSYRLRLVDEDGLEGSGESEYFIRLMDDRPPQVRILRPSGDQQITPLEEVAIQARADDDYGVAAFDLVYAVAGGREQTVPFEHITGTDIERVGSRLLHAEDLDVKPGDVVTYYARARDVARGKRSTEARSDIFFLEVKPFNEEFVAAQSQASSGAANADIGGLVAAQKEIISATWNIERRAGAGRSADDVAAIAKAQAELKARAQKMTRGPGDGRRRGRAPGPESVAPQGARPQEGGPDPVAAAVDAMARAIVELEGRRTKTAIQHEMAALTGLLQAQAENTRRQVSQGAGGSGNAGNRAGQDLTALFDKELQRQQRTNYETRSSVENTPQQGDDAALDRIRDLAKRQEDLNRRQRELAEAGLDAGEMKRQLEKLTREQMELRQQAEELARKPQGQGTGSSMQNAVEQMRSAASDLRREDAKGALESGSRAADQLRRAEEQMRGSGSGAAKQRQAGTLQMDAQQMAQEQRRIAAEAERLDKGQGSAGGEARRRLAVEKERLAGRVEDLQRSAAREGQSSAKGKDAAAMSDAAKALERERIAERMRESARSMRMGQPGGAATEQDLSRALERAVRKLGGDPRAEADQLAGQLEHTRAIRERLNRLEQQMRQAEAAQQGSRGREGRQGSRGTSGDGQQAGDLKKLQQEYRRELERAREALGRLSAAQQRSGKEMSTPEQEEFSRSAPGTEAFKQDRSGWESLRKEIDLSLEKYEASLSNRLARPQQDRLNGGGSDRVPEGYRDWIARYYQSLAKVKK